MVLFLFDLPFSYETKVYHVTIAAPRGELIRGCCLCTVLRRAEYHFSTRSSDHGNGTKHFEQASRQASRQTSRDSMHQQDHCNVVDIKLPHWKENHMDRLLKSKGTIVHSLLITKKNQDWRCLPAASTGLFAAIQMVFFVRARCLSAGLRS